MNTKICPYCKGKGYIISEKLSKCSKGIRHAYTLPDGSRTDKCLLCEELRIKPRTQADKKSVS